MGWRHSFDPDKGLVEVVRTEEPAIPRDGFERLVRLDHAALGALEADKAWMLVILMVSSVLNIAYLLPIPVRAFFAKERADAGVQGHEDHGESPWACRIPLILSSLACLILFFWPGIYAQLAKMIEGSAS